MLVRDGHRAWLDLLLMSCRVLGRNVEYVLLRRLLECASTWVGVRAVHGVYIPTAKNHHVATFLDRAGFVPVTEPSKVHDPGTTEWVFEVGARPVAVPDYVTVLDYAAAV
jgi:predicted enzyme involved in methoxymalonyl-ACP biosynthesis